MMNKKMALITATLAATSLLSSSSMATEGAGTASATVQAAITVSQTTAMQFGDITSAAGATCQMEPGTDTPTGDGCAGGTTSAGVFEINSEAATLDIMVSIANPIQGDVTFAPAWSNGALDFAANETGTLVTSGGSTNLDIGGTLTNGSNPAPGDRSWDYTVTVTYQ